MAKSKQAKRAGVPASEPVSKPVSRTASVAPAALTAVATSPGTASPASVAAKVKAPVMDRRVTARILSSIKAMIASGEIVPGGKFPPERELARQLNVNRATLRQVMKLLEIMSVLTQRVGDGTYLNATAESILIEPIEFMVLIDDISDSELFETRLVVEPELAARAAARATAENLASLRTSIVQMENSRTHAERIDADAAFHDHIFSASGNRICQLLFKVIHKTVLSAMAQGADRIELEKTIRSHKDIYNAIRDHNPESARKCMLEHLSEAAAAALGEVRTK